MRSLAVAVALLHERRKRPVAGQESAEPNFGRDHRQP